MHTPCIIHVDADAFFASVEQALDPSLRGRPVVVGGGVGGRGVVAAASYEARRLGLSAGMPIARARERCPDAVCVPPRFEEYNRFAARMFDVFSGVTPLVEQPSPDECYLDLRGCERLYGAWTPAPFARIAPGVYRRREGDRLPAARWTSVPASCSWPAAVALRIRRAVRGQLGLNVSAGIGSNKLIAKLASKLAKPDGAALVAPGYEADFLATIDLKDVPGIGPVTRERLHRWNVRSVEQARRLPPEVWEDAFGPERGAALYGLVRGDLPCEAAGLRADGPPRSISRETTFWSASGDYAFVESMLFYLTERLGRALRRERVHGRTVQVKLRYQDAAAVQCARTLRAPTDGDAPIFAAARSLLRARWTRTRRLRLVGVGLADLRPVLARQDSLFDGDAEHARRIDRCLDGLRDRFGFDVIRRGLSINLDRADRPEPARP